MTSYIWCIAGSIVQVAMIQAVKARGYKVLVTDINPEAEGAKLADRFVRMDTYDHDSHRQLAKEFSDVRAVVTAGADVGPSVSAAAEVLHLPCVPFDVAIAVRAKHLLHKSLRLPHPVFLAEHEKDLDKDLPDWGMVKKWETTCKVFGVPKYPCVVKPSDNCATRGISVIHNDSEWSDALQQVAYSGKKERYVLVEEMLQPTCEVATDSFVYDGRVHYANGVYRYFRGFGIEMGHLNPLTPESKVIKLIEHVAKSLKITWGPLKVDLIKDRRYGWVVGEAATRLSGAFDHSLSAPIATGRDVTNAYLDMALGLPLDIAKITPRWHKWCFTYTPQYPPGPILGWDNEQPVRDMVEHLFVRERAHVPALKDCAARPVFILTSGNTAQEAIRKGVKAGKILRPRVRHPIGSENE